MSDVLLADDGMPWGPTSFGVSQTGRVKERQRLNERIMLEVYCRAGQYDNIISIL